MINYDFQFKFNKVILNFKPDPSNLIILLKIKKIKFIMNNIILVVLIGC